MRAGDDPRISNLLTQKKKYTSLEIGIEMVQVILLQSYSKANSFVSNFQKKLLNSCVSAISFSTLKMTLKRSLFTKTNCYLHCSLILLCMDYLIDIKSIGQVKTTSHTPLFHPNGFCNSLHFFCLNALPTMYFSKNVKNSAPPA